MTGALGAADCGITWNSITFTPEGGSATVVRNGAHCRSLQNDATQRFGRPLGVSATVLPGVPATTSRYLYVLVTEPGRSGPVHGASESAVLPLGCTASSATVASCASSRYMSWRESVLGSFDVQADVCANAARAFSVSPAFANMRPSYRYAQASLRIAFALRGLASTAARAVPIACANATAPSLKRFASPALTPSETKLSTVGSMCASFV